MNIEILFILFLLLLIIPFLPGIIEYFRKKDVEHIKINLEYYKDPLYFGKEFKKFLELLQNPDKKNIKIYKISENTLQIEFSKDKTEIIKIYENTIISGENNEILLVKGNNVETNGPIISQKEIAVEGNLTINHPLETKALFIQGNILVKSNLNVKYWIHTEGKAKIENKSILGINAFFREIQILSSCVFKRMFSYKITIGEDLDEKNFQKDISLFKGTIKAKRDITIKTQDKKLVIEGDIISDKSIIIEGDVWIKGNVFSHTGIVILNGAIVGQNNQIKSVVAKKKIILVNNCKIYGYLHTEGIGIVQI